MRAQGSGPLSATTIAFLLVSIAAVALLIWTQTSTPHGAGYSDVEDEHYVDLAEANENDEQAEAEELTGSEDQKEIAKTSKSKKDSKTKLKAKTSKSKGLTKSNKAEKKKSDSKKGKSDKTKSGKSKKDKKDKKDKKSKSKSDKKSKNKKKSESDEDKTQSKRGKKKKRTPPKTEEKAEETTAIVAHEYEHNANMAITGQFLVRWDGCIQTDQCSVYRNEAQAFCDRMGEKCAGYTCGKGAAICQIRSPPLQYHPSNDFEAFFKRDPKK